MLFSEHSLIQLGVRFNLEYFHTSKQFSNLVIQKTISHTKHLISRDVHTSYK